LNTTLYISTLVCSWKCVLCDNVIFFPEKSSIYSCLFKVDCEASYPYLYQSLSTAHSRWNSSHFLNEVWEEGEARPILICWALIKEASGTIFIPSLAWSGQPSNPRPPAYGANALTTEPPLRKRKIFNLLNIMHSLYTACLSCLLIECYFFK